MEEVLERLRQIEASQQELKVENERLKQELLMRESQADEKEAAAAEKERKKAEDDAARSRWMPQVGGAVDTRIMNKPDSFYGKDEDWPQFALITRAYVGAISPKMFELLKKAEDANESIDRVDLDPGDDHLDTQLYYILTMLLKGTAIDKVSLVEYGEGLYLWRLLISEYEPKWKTRKTATHQAILNYELGPDVMASLDGFEKLIRQYKSMTSKIIDDDTKAGIVLSALSRSVADQRHQELAEHLVLNAHRVNTYDEIKTEIREILGTKKYLNMSRGDVGAIGKGKKGGGKGGGTKGEITIKFAGECFLCGKPGHRKADCWHKDSATAKAKAKPKAKPKPRPSPGGGKPFTGKCDHCGIQGHKKSECRKLKAEQGAAASSSGGDERGPKRKRTDISAIEEQLAALNLSIQTLKDSGNLGSLSISNVDAEIGAVGSSGDVLIGLDSGAEVTVWPPELHPGVPTEPSIQSRSGVKYFGPGDKDGPTLVNEGMRKYDLDFDGVRRQARVNVVKVRRPLLALCDLFDHGHDIHFTKAKGCWAEHRETGETINITRNGGKYEMRARVMNSASGSSGNDQGRAQP